MTQSMEEANHKVVRYFQSIMNCETQDNREEKYRFLNRIPPFISKEYNMDLYKLVTMEEFRIVTFQINPDKDLGLDGFLTKFINSFGIF